MQSNYSWHVALEAEATVLHPKQETPKPPLKLVLAYHRSLAHLLPRTRLLQCEYVLRTNSLRLHDTLDML